MNEHPLQSFIALIECDRRIQALTDARAALDNQIALIQARQDTAQQDIEQARAALVALKKEVDAQELEMSYLDAQEKEKKRRLETISNYKEYSSLQQEVTALQNRQIATEQTLMATWNRLELAQRMLEKKEKDFVHIRENFDAEKAAQLAQHETLLHQLAELEKERVQKEERVPQEWREKYAAMRSRVTNPVVEILDGSCSACFYGVPEQDLIRLRRGALIQCKHCFRFLYTPSMLTK